MPSSAQLCVWNPIRRVGEFCSPNDASSPVSRKMNTEIRCCRTAKMSCAAGLCLKYASRPPSNVNCVSCRSGISTLNGTLPWNHGFTVCASVETTSTGLALAIVATCWSTSCDNGERSEEHTSELQSRFDLVCRLLLEKKKEAEITTSGPAR